MTWVVEKAIRFLRNPCCPMQCPQRLLPGAVLQGKVLYGIVLYGTRNPVVFNGELAVPTKNWLISSAIIEKLC